MKKRKTIRQILKEIRKQIKESRYHIREFYSTSYCFILDTSALIDLENKRRMGQDVTGFWKLLDEPCSFLFVPPQIFYEMQKQNSYKKNRHNFVISDQTMKIIMSYMKRDLEKIIVMGADPLAYLVWQTYYHLVKEKRFRKVDRLSEGDKQIMTYALYFANNGIYLFFDGEKIKKIPISNIFVLTSDEHIYKTLEFALSNLDELKDYKTKIKIIKTK